MLKVFLMFFSLAATKLLWQIMRRGRIALGTLKCTLTEATMDSRQEYSYFIHLVECHYMYSSNIQSRYAAAISITFAATLQAELDAFPPIPSSGPQGQVQARPPSVLGDQGLRQRKGILCRSEVSCNCYAVCPEMLHKVVTMYLG